jgi:hypothetical protein
VSVQQRIANTTSLTSPKSLDPLKADFRNFLYAVWKHLGLPDPTLNQYDIAQWLQHGPKRLITEAFRGVGKSWATAAYVCWLLYCDPQHRIMVVSANATKANEFSTFTLQLISEMPILAHLIPRHGQRQSMLAFDVGPAKPDIAPSVKSVGITGQLTGSRSDTIVADDIEVPHNSDTQGKRDRLAELIKEFDAVLKPGGRIIYLGTPQTEQSIYNAELPARGYVVRIWPARYPKDPEGKLSPVAYMERKYGPRMAPLIANALKADPSLAGQSTEPTRFPDEDLKERALSYGRAGFALQFMLDTSLSDADKFPLKLSDLIVYPLDHYRAPIDLVWASSPDLIWKDLPMVGLLGDRYYQPAWVSQEFAPYEGAVMFVDPSGRGKDETSYAVVKLLHGRLFWTASGGFLGGYDDDTLKAILMVAKKQNVHRILCEPNYGGGMFTKLLQSAAQRQYPCGIEDAEWSKVAKEERIVDTLEPVLNQHRLVVCPSVIQTDYDSVADREGERVPYYRAMYQISHMVRAKGALAQDDRLDALAGAVAHWTKQVARDTEQAAIEHKEHVLDRELQKFVEGIMKGGGIGAGRQAPVQRYASQTARLAAKRG